MITPCQKCGNVILVPTGTPVRAITSVLCKCGHQQMLVGMPSLLEPMRIGAGRAFPWLPEFPPRR